MEVDEKITIYNRGVETGKRHREPSPDTRHFMEKMNVDFQLMKKDINNILKGLEENSKEHKEMREALPTFVPQIECNKNTTHLVRKIDDLTKQVLEMPEKLLEKMDGRYITKDAFVPVQRIAYGLIAVMVTVIIWLLFKK